MIIDRAVRLSILYSITRFIFPEAQSRRVACCFTIVFVLLWLGVVVQKAYHCGSNLTWYPVRSCSMPRWMDIYEFGCESFCVLLEPMDDDTCAPADLISDIILVSLPLRMLWNIKLPERGQRRMILCIFSSSIVVSLVSFVRAIFRFMQVGMLIITASEFQVRT